VCFNTHDGTSRDATFEFAQKIRDRADRKGESLSPGLREFIDYELSRGTQLV